MTVVEYVCKICDKVFKEEPKRKPYVYRGFIIPILTLNEKMLGHMYYSHGIVFELVDTLKHFREELKYD